MSGGSSGNEPARATMEAIISKTQPAAAKLSDTQLVVLNAAAQRDDGSLLPFPEALIKGAALSNVVDTLCKRKLVEEQQTLNGAPEWRRDEDRGPLGLFITKSGLLALGIDETEKTKPSQAPASMARHRKTAAEKPRNKTRKASAANQSGHRSGDKVGPLCAKSRHPRCLFPASCSL